MNIIPWCVLSAPFYPDTHVDLIVHISPPWLEIVSNGKPATAYLGSRGPMSSGAFAPSSEHANNNRRGIKQKL